MPREKKDQPAKKIRKARANLEARRKEHAANPPGKVSGHHAKMPGSMKG